MDLRAVSIIGIVLYGLLAVCGAPAHAADGDADPGPTATVYDTVQGDGGPHSSGRFFTLAQIDNGPRLRTSLDRSKSASFGQGFRLSLLGQSSTVKAGPAHVKLVGRVAYAAPIQEMFAGSRLRSVEGEVDVVLLPGRSYAVTGFLDAYRREIWIEDVATREVLGTKVVAQPDPAKLAQSLASGKFTCCNLHYDEAQISDENFQPLPFIPAGARIAIVKFNRKTVDVLIDGRPMELRVYVGDNIKGKQPNPEELARQLIVDSDPSALLPTFPAAVDEAIRACKVLPGMTKPQVLMSLGYPWPDKTPSLDARAWSYHTGDDDEYTVVWGSDDRVQSVEGPAEVKRLVMP